MLSEFTQNRNVGGKDPVPAESAVYLLSSAFGLKVSDRCVIGGF
jgi:hypothetical protein